MRAAVVLLAVMGCGDRQRPIETTPASLVSPGDVVGFELVPAHGDAPLTAWVRAVDSTGASVAAEVYNATLNGAAVAVTFDNQGYGAVVLDEPGVYTLEVDGQTEEYVVSAPWTVMPALDRTYPAPATDSTLVTGVTDGVVVAADNEVYWMGRDKAPHRVLATEGKILGLVTAELDVDPLLDAIAWTNSRVYLLLGHAGGGMAAGGMMVAEGYTVGGAVAADVSGDNVPDLAVAWAKLGSGTLDLWFGQGADGFLPQEATPLSAQPVGITYGDNTDVDQVQLTVITANGSWSRFQEGSPGRLIPIGPRSPAAVAVPFGAQPVGSADFDGDGAEELMTLEARSPGSTTDIFLFNLAGESIQYLPLEGQGAPFVGVADGNGDNIDDVFMLTEDGQFEAVAYDPLAAGSSSYKKRNLFDPPGVGAYTVFDNDSDGAPELMLAADERWWWYTGQNKPWDPDFYWAPSGGPQIYLREGVTGPYLPMEGDGKPETLEFITLSDEAESPSVRVIQYIHGEGRATRIGTKTLGGSRSIDVAYCAPYIWALSEGELMTIDATDPTYPTRRADLAVSGTDVACGSGPSGAAGAMLQADGTVLMYDVDLNQVGSDNRPGATDLELDAGTLASCDLEDCTMVQWPGRGWVQSSPTTARIGDQTLEGVGLPVVGDLDGDGVSDLVLFDPAQQLYTVHRVIPEGTLVETYHLGRTFQSISLSDFDGDGWLDLFGLEEDVLYIVLEPPEVTTAATGGSGTTSPTGGTGSPGSTGSTGDTSAP